MDPRALVEAMRPHQWVKNLLVFAPLLFAHRLLEPDSLWASCRAFATFSMLASAVYLGNDAADREADRRHPRKRNRPIASGRLSVPAALIAAGVLVVGALALAWTLPAGRNGLPFVTWPLTYVGVNIAYSLGLKRVAILDLMCIALGFQFRVHAGSVAIEVESSRWLLLCTFFFATFLAACKRREELASADPAGEGATRASLRDYTLTFIDQLTAPLAALSILAYALYTLDAETVEKHGPNLMVTVPIVTFGVFRYLWLVHTRDAGGDPSRTLVRDPQILASGVLYVAAVATVVRWLDA